MSARPLVRDCNTLDYSLLEPGDILMLANPTDMPVIRFVVFWSHVGIVTVQGDVIDAVREPRGEYTEDIEWHCVRRSPLKLYRAGYDILAVRPCLPRQARVEAARYAERYVGAPYAASAWRVVFGRRDTKGYSCASLMWQAYEKQGLNLAPAPAWCEYNVVPLFLARDPHVDVIARGTRYRPIPPSCRRLRLERRWFRYVLGADILLDGVAG